MNINQDLTVGEIVAQDYRTASVFHAHGIDFCCKGGRKLGFLELYKAAGEGGKPKFLVKTEHTRWYAEVIASAAEQVEQDLGSVVKAP